MSTMTLHRDTWRAVTSQLERRGAYDLLHRVTDALAMLDGSDLQHVALEFDCYEQERIDLALLGAQRFGPDTRMGELIEALAEAEYRLNVDRRLAHVEWNQLPEVYRERHRGRVMVTYLPRIRDVVGRWIEDDRGSGEQVSRSWLADQWRRETGDD